MEDKDPEIAKKTALSDGEMPSDLEDLGEEEVAQAFESLKMGQGEKGTNPSIIHDPKMEAEIKEMFRDIVSQYITPVGKSIRALDNGDTSERNIEICIGALKPLTGAAEEIHYNDIYDVLKSIEQPLVAFQSGKKRLLSKKDIRNITTDYKELMRLISRSVGSEMVETSTGTVRATTAAPVAKSLERLAELHISDALIYFKDSDPRDIQRLYAGGLIKLGLLSQATAQEISESTGIALEAAERLKHCAINALDSLKRATSHLPAPEDADEILISRSELHSLRHRFEEDEEPSIPIAKTPDAGGKQRWHNALEAMASELNHYYQSATALSTELERTHRALVRLRVARERFKGELEFSQDDLCEMLETNETLNQELGTPLNAHRQLLKNLHRSIDLINSATRKADLIYTQVDESMEDLLEIESQMIALRRHKAAVKNRPLRQRNADAEDDQPNPERQPRRLN